MALFLSLLTPEERKEFDATGKVTLTGSKGGVYQLVTINNSVTDNVHHLDPATGARTATLCAAPNMWPTGSQYGQRHLPMPDGWVGQLLALRYNEDEFLRHAVVSRYRPW
jgi:hypothetical protein